MKPEYLSLPPSQMARGSIKDVFNAAANCFSDSEHTARLLHEHKSFLLDFDEAEGAVADLILGLMLKGDHGANGTYTGQNLQYFIENFVTDGPNDLVNVLDRLGYKLTSIQISGTTQFIIETARKSPAPAP